MRPCWWLRYAYKLKCNSTCGLRFLTYGIVVKVVCASSFFFILFYFRFLEETSFMIFSVGMQSLGVKTGGIEKFYGLASLHFQPASIHTQFTLSVSLFSFFQ